MESSYLNIFVISTYLLCSCLLILRFFKQGVKAGPCTRLYGLCSCTFDTWNLRKHRLAFRPSLVPCICSEGPLVRKSISQKVHESDGPLVRRSVSQNNLRTCLLVNFLEHFPQFLIGTFEVFGLNGGLEECNYQRFI